MDWGVIFQSILVAACAWYVRQGSTQDAKGVVRETASQVTGDEILRRVKALENELSLVKRVIARDTRPDDRGPARR